MIGATGRRRPASSSVSYVGAPTRGSSATTCRSVGSSDCSSRSAVTASPSAIATRAPLSPSTCRHSSADRPGSIGTTLARRPYVAWQATIHSRRLAATIATASPSPTPRPASPPRNAATRSWSSLYATHHHEPPSRIPTASAPQRACQRSSQSTTSGFPVHGERDETRLRDDTEEPARPPIHRHPDVAELRVHDRAHRSDADAGRSQPLAELVLGEREADRDEQLVEDHRRHARIEAQRATDRVDHARACPRTHRPRDPAERPEHHVVPA